MTEYALERILQQDDIERECSLFTRFVLFVMAIGFFGVTIFLFHTGFGFLRFSSLLLYNLLRKKGRNRTARTQVHFIMWSRLSIYLTQVGHSASPTEKSQGSLEFLYSSFLHYTRIFHIEYY